MGMTIFRLGAATLFPVLFALLLYQAGKKTRFADLPYRWQQLIIGVVFGGVAVLATEFGIPLDGAVMNVRSAAPLTAGLLFGGPAGIIAGIIGGVERWFSVYWGGGEYTQLACSLATILAGFFGAAMRKYIFDNKKAHWMAGLAIGLTTEVLHMLLVFITNMSDIQTAYSVVEKCAPVMIPLNAIAVALALGLVALLGKEKRELRKSKKQIAQIFRFGLLICVTLGFCATCLFTMLLQVRISEDNASTLLKLGVEEVPRNIEEITDNTLQMYAEWVAVDIQAEQGPPDYELMLDLAEEYVVPELHVTDPDGKIYMSNCPELMGEVYLGAEPVEDFGPSFHDPELGRLYVTVELSDGDLLLVGYDKSFVVDEVSKRMETVATNRHIGQTGFVIISDEAGLIVSGSREQGGRTLREAGLELAELYSHGENVKFMTTIYDIPVRCMYQRISTVAQDYTVIAALPDKEAEFARNIAVYITAFMEILVFAALFILLYFLVKRVVVDNIHKVNASLARITGGDLNETVNVRENEEFASLTDDINSTVTTLKHYIDEAAARIDKELEFAKAIQHSALPSVFPPYPNRRDFDVYALMDTAKEVGGDFYDFYLLDNDRFGFLIADVSGKGIPAAMFMMTAKTVIKGLAESGLEVQEIFTRTNAKLCQGNETGMFVTAWIGILDLRSGELSFANAGHNPPLIRHKNGSFEFLRTRPNFILAGMDNTKYRKELLQLLPGDELFLYTDGVTEAIDADKNMFREERLLAQLNKDPEESVTARCQNVLAELNAFVGEAEQFDDITMLSVKLNHLQTFDRIVVCPDLASTDAVWEFIDLKIKKAELPRKLANKLKVCTDEIYSNILRYSQATKAEIFCKIEDDLLTLTFRDNGVPYDPTAATDPDVTMSAQEREIGGLGIYMVKKTARSLVYEYAEGQNILTLTFSLEQ